MSDPEPQARGSESDPEDTRSQGPSLTVIYSFIALALVAAIGFAMLVVLPFYHRR
jgi:hypothetical protein